MRAAKKRNCGKQFVKEGGDMKKGFETLYVKEIKITESKLQIELENILKIDSLFWSKNSLLPSFKIERNSFEISGKVISIFIKDSNIEPFIRYYLIAKIGGHICRFYQRNHEQYPRALRCYDLGIGSHQSLHKVVFINDFGNIGLKIVPQIILDTFDRRLPINVELTDISTEYKNLIIKVRIEWSNEFWEVDRKIVPFITELNSLADDRIYAIESFSKIGNKEVEIDAKFTGLSKLEENKDYAFGIEVGVRNCQYSLLTTRVSKSLFDKFFPFYKGINLTPEDAIEFNFTTNTAITLCRKRSFEQSGASLTFTNDFENFKSLSKVERSYADEAYQLLECHWNNQAAYHNFLRKKE
jgi:hypothetical protein